MTNEELTKFLYSLNKEYGRGWDAGKGPPDMYGNRAISSQEGWSDILKDQLKFNQFNDLENLGLLSNREDVKQVLRSRLEDNPDYYRIKELEDPKDWMRTNGVPVGPQLLSEAPFTDSSLGPAGSLGLPSASSSLALEAGPSGYASLTASGVESALPYAAEGTAESLAADTAASGSSAWGGPATFAGNMALNLIPTRDRDKVDTPLGDEGSMSGILKGGGKGALIGGTIGSAVAPGPGTAIGAVIGGTLGVAGGAQGYFDSTTPPQIQIGRIKRGGGRMPQGLLGGIYA